MVVAVAAAAAAVTVVVLWLTGGPREIRTSEREEQRRSPFNGHCGAENRTPRLE